jgi:hypothetical protein
MLRMDEDGEKHKCKKDDSAGHDEFSPEMGIDAQHWDTRCKAERFRSGSDTKRDRRGKRRRACQVMWRRQNSSGIQVDDQGFKTRRLRGLIHRCSSYGRGRLLMRAAPALIRLLMLWNMF